MESIFSKLLFLISGLVFLLFTHCTEQNSSSVKDIDGNTYRTVRIGEQVWMAENLKVTRYRNGDSIDHIMSNEAWRRTSSGAYCHYNNDSSNLISYGLLYNWFAINDARNIAPEGWHIPTPEEWNLLMDNLGGDEIAGGKLKQKNDLWLSPNKGATNESGFSALPGGYRFTPGGTFHTRGTNGYWWSTVMSYQLYAWSPRLFYNFADVDREFNYKNYGFSVRCVKDK